MQLNESSGKPGQAHLPLYDFTAPELLPVLGSFYAYGYLDLAPEIITPEQMPLVTVDPNRERYPNAITAYTLSDLFATLLSEDDPNQPSFVEVFGHPVIFQAIGPAFSGFSEHPLYIEIGTLSRASAKCAASLHA